MMLRNTNKNQDRILTNAECATDLESADIRAVLDVCEDLDAQISKLLAEIEKLEKES